MLWATVDRVLKLHLLASLSHHSPYTYAVSGHVLRGSRPIPKLSQLYAGGCEATINLCREALHGDDDLIAAAGLKDKMVTRHLEITDSNTSLPPKKTSILLSGFGRVQRHERLRSL